MDANKIYAVDYSSCMMYVWSCEDVRLLWRLGAYIYRRGCRRDIELVITDMYLKGKMSDEDCETLREIVMGLDKNVEQGLVAPRLELITNLILKINE